MKSFQEKERLCELVFDELGQCWHLWTSEGFEIIFDKDEEYKIGMCLIAICARLFPDITILTFEIMSNHIHICAAGKEERLKEFFKWFKMFLMNYMTGLGKTIDWNAFIASTREIQTLDDLRNVIAYDNRNGFLVHPESTPFSYPWGANKYFFNDDAKYVALTAKTEMSLRMRRQICHTRLADNAKGIPMLNGYAVPLYFCDIQRAEMLFRDAAHYFYKLGKSVETNAKIAKEIQENVFYTDDELNDVIYNICREKYNVKSPSLLSSEAKVEMAKMMKYDYNASVSKIERRLHMNKSVLEALFGKR